MLGLYGMTSTSKNIFCFLETAQSAISKKQDVAKLIPKRYEAERVLKAVSLISQGLQPVYYAHPHSRLVLCVTTLVARTCFKALMMPNRANAIYLYNSHFAVGANGIRPSENEDLRG
jgi:hypothetical protein